MRLSLLLCAVWLAWPARAAVNDILPADYFPPAASSLALYAYDRNLDGPYANGEPLLDGKIDSQALALRAVWATEWQGYRVAPVVLLPWVRSEAAAPLDAILGRRAEGMGDARIGVTIWPLADKERARYLGVTGMAILPTGDYDSRQVLNSGENRWRFVLVGGFQQEIARDLLAEVIPEIAWYGENDDYRNGRRLQQDSSRALTAYLRYRLTPAWHVHVGGQINRGGATRIDGIDQHNPPDNTRTMLGVTWIGPAGQQAILRFGKDTEIENGFRTRREILLRFSQSY